MLIADDRSGVSRLAILAAILVCWGGGLAAMARRQAADHTDARRLAAAAARVTPRDIYFNIQQNGQQVGFAQSHLDTADGGFYLTEYLMADRWTPVTTARGPMMRMRRTMLSSRVWLTHTFALRRYIVASDTGSGETIVQIDPVGDTAVTIRSTPPASQGAPSLRTMRGTPLTLAPSLLPLAVALTGRTPRVGSQTAFDELDPVDGPHRVTLAVAAESLFVVPDSSVYDSTAATYKQFSADTLRAWRLVPDGPLIGGGVPVVEWIDDEGRIVSAAATVPAVGPVTLVRTTYDLAHNNWSGKNIFFRKARSK
jgi:hypothetical protein